MDSTENFFSLEQYAHRSLWKEGGPVWNALLLLKNYLSEKKNFRIEIDIPKGVILENSELISIGEGTIIEPHTYIKGPFVMGKNGRICHGAYVREFVLCGDDCVIGHSAEIKHSILLDRASATHFTYVGDSILGNDVNLGAGVKCANLRLDRKDVDVFLNQKRVKTGLQKFGAIVGDRSQIGCNSVLNPGTLVSKDCISHPLMNLNGFVPQGSEVSPKGIKILEKLLCQSKSTAKV